MKRNRRSFLKYGGAASVAALAGCTGGDSEQTDAATTTQSGGGGTTTKTSQDLTTMHTVVPEGSLYVIPFMYGTRHNAWSQYGIDLKVEVGPFPKFQRQIVAGIANVGGMPMVSGLDFRTKGEDLTWLGPGMTFANFMLAKKGSGIETPKDIKGKTLGVPFKTSTTTVGYQALMQDAYGMSLLDAPKEVRTGAPPVVWNLLKQGEVDVILEFSGFSIKGQLDDDIKVVFNPISYWKEKYGSVVPLTQRTARMSWLKKNRTNAELAVRWGQGWKTALRLFRNNIDAAIDQYGRLGGLTSKEMGDVVIDRMEREVQFNTPPYTEKQADSHWQFAKALKQAGVYDSLPPRNKMITTTSELEELANK